MRLQIRQALMRAVINKVMKSAVIGLGVIGNVHLKVLNSLNKNVVAVCDTDLSKLSDFNGNKYSDYVEMIEKEKPDIVHICTPHYLHAQMIIDCLKNNINVLCEKPLCINEDDIQKILQAEKESEAQLGVVLQNRYNNSNLFVKEYLKGKKVADGFGIVDWHRNSSYYNSAFWRGKTATEGGGVLINQALHTLDILQWLIGMPEKVVANVNNFTLKDVIEVEDSAMACFSGKNKFTFFATNTGALDFPVEITIRTAEDYIKLLPEMVILNKEVIKFENQNNFFGKHCYGTGHENLIDDFYNCIEQGKKFWLDGSEGSKVMKLIFGTYKSKGEIVDI